MALAAANSILSQNRTSFVPLTNLPFHKQPHKLYSHSQFKRTHQSKLPSFVISSSAAGNAAVSDVHLRGSTSSDTTVITSWSEFARNVSGEWDGFGADFTSEGKPVELPESVVPEAYREWEVKVFDWQTQCPTLARPDNPSMTYKTIKLLPTVGCEADAATRYSVDERIVGTVDNKVLAFAYQSSGCYVAMWPIQDHGMHKLLELEYCLINPQDRESRVRVVQVIRLGDTSMELQNVKVFCEQWYGPFRNGEQLGGCAIRDSAFASTAAILTSQVVGDWQSTSAVARFSVCQISNLQELVDDSEQKTTRDERNLILLPKQLWCVFKTNEDGEMFSEAGWLLNNGHAITSRCIFSGDAKLKEFQYHKKLQFQESLANNNSSNQPQGTCI